MQRFSLLISGGSEKKLNNAFLTNGKKKPKEGK